MGRILRGGDDEQTAVANRGAGGVRRGGGLGGGMALPPLRAARRPGGCSARGKGYCVAADAERIRADRFLKERGRIDDRRNHNDGRGADGGFFRSALPIHAAPFLGDVLPGRGDDARTESAAAGEDPRAGA